MQNQINEQISKQLDKQFYARDAKTVARELLGKILARKRDGEILKAKIVETEAYYGPEDPASRACKNGDLKRVMESEAGTLLVYGVHNNWLVNIVTNKKGEASAVLLRALEPLNFQARCCGPGLLTKAISIDKSFHGQDIINNKELSIIGFNDSSNNKENNNFENLEIIEAFRIGVTKDLPEKLRFYIKNNKHVSRK